MKARTALFLALVLLTAGRIAAATGGGFTALEAYYWLLGEHWDWASFDGPGGFPAVVAGVCGAVGQKAWALRVLGPVWALCATAGIWWFGRRLAGKGAAFWACVAWNILPAVNGEALSFGPELLAAALWVWFLGMSWVASTAKNNRAAWWFLAGVVCAAGSLVSYWMLLAPAGLLLFWFLGLSFWQEGKIGAVLCGGKTGGGGRGEDSVADAEKPVDLQPVLSLGAAFVFLLPAAAMAGPWQWNQATGWIAFAGQTWESLTAFGGGRSWMECREVLVGLGGPLAVFLIFGLAVAGKKCFVQPRERWLAAFSLPLVFWVVAGVWRGEVSVLALVLVGVLPALRAAEILLSTPRCERVFFPRLAGACALIAAGISFFSLADRSEEKAEPDWAQVGERIERVARIYRPADRPELFLVAGNRDSAAGLGFFLSAKKGKEEKGNFPPIFLLESQDTRNQFGLWPRYDEFLDSADVVPDELFREQKGHNPFMGRDAIYIGEETPDALPRSIFDGFGKVVPLEVIADGAGTRFYLYYCEDYQTAPL